MLPRVHVRPSKAALGCTGGTAVSGSMGAPERSRLARADLKTRREACQPLERRGERRGGRGDRRSGTGGKEPRDRKRGEPQASHR